MFETKVLYINRNLEKDFNNKNTLVEGQKSTNAPLRYEVTTTVRLTNKVSQDKVVEICCIQTEYVQTVQSKTKSVQQINIKLSCKTTETDLIKSIKHVVDVVFNFLKGTDISFNVSLSYLCGGTQHTHRDSALARYLVSCHARQTP